MNRILLISLLLLSNVIYAQLPSGTKILFRPIELRIPTESVAITLQHSDPSSGIEPWFVYSDKKINYSFEKPGRAKPFKKLEYLEQFAVIAEKGAYIHIAKIKSYNTSTFSIGNDSEDYGWVKKHDVLLWRNCIVTNIGNIERKAMIMNTLNLVASRADISKLEDNVVEFYYEPALRESTGRKAQLYEVFFAYKITDTAVLLGNVARISDETERLVKEGILGWVPRHRIVMWDHRVAIEPNWDEKAVQERKSNNVRASVFATKAEAAKYQVQGVNASASAIMDERSINGDIYNERMIGEWQRYPVYRESGQIAQVGVMGQILTGKGEFDKVYKAEADRQVRIASAKRRNINIVFVIDGTTSMGPYINAVSSAIVSGMEQINLRYPGMKNIIRFGSVVYRDFPERDRLIEIRDLTSNYEDIAAFLNSIDATDRYDTDIPEAVNYGLLNALNGLLTDDNETNIIVLVGDAGDHNRSDDSNIDHQIVSELIAQKNAGLLAFQVHNDQHPSYDEFRTQIQNIMKNAGQIIYQQTRQNNLSLAAPVWTEMGNNVMRLDNYTNMASIVYADKLQRMNTSLLTNEIVLLVDYAVRFTDELISGVQQVISGGSALADITQQKDQFVDGPNKYISSFSPALFNFLYNQTKIPKEKLEYLVENKYQLYTEGYAPLITNNTNSPLFRKVLLLSREDLQKVIANINRLHRASSRNDRRMAMQQTYLDMIKRHIGEKTTVDFMKMSIEEINTKIFGLPGTNSIINRLRLEDLTNPGVISDSDLHQYATAIEMKYNTLNRIFNSSSSNPYKYSFSMTEVVYHWIEDDLLP